MEVRLISWPEKFVPRKFKTRPDISRGLAADEDAPVRAAVAWNRETVLRDLRIFEKDPSWVVRKDAPCALERRGEEPVVSM